MGELSFKFPTILQNILHQLSYTPNEPLMFSSGLFWVFAIVFLPIYAAVKSRRTLMMVFVTLFSLFFFYKSSGWALLLLVITSVIDWKMAKYIEEEDNDTLRRAALVFSIICSLGLLVYFKYANFLIVNINALMHENFQPMDILLPIGISFYTFRTISYVVDVYKRKIDTSASFLEYIFFLSFFPCLIAGPIVRAESFLPQLRENKPATKEMVYGGMWLVMMGIIKKAVIADYIAQYVNIAYGNPSGYTGVEILMAVIGYSLQIYCDFSGYSDMAIGLGSMMGFDLGINFDFPYRSLNVTEFWRKWHISLSFWLRDYVYIPMGGNRHGKIRQYFNLLVTMLVGGLWHGAAWNFIIWGGGHGAALCMHKLMMPQLKKIPNNYFVSAISILVTFTIVSILWVFFRAESMNHAIEILSGVVTRFDPAYIPVFLQVRYVLCLVMGLVIVTHFIPKRIYDNVQAWFINSWWIVKLIVFVVVVQLVIEFAAADINPLIYATF